VGKQIYFGAGEPTPSTPKGKKPIAPEVWHIKQPLAQAKPSQAQVPKSTATQPTQPKTTQQSIQTKPLVTPEQNRLSQGQVPSAVLLNNKTQPTYENLNDPKTLAVQAKQIGQGSDGKAIADMALKTPQQFLSDSQQNLKTVKDVKPTEPKDEGWFENPEHQKGLAKLKFCLKSYG
jgi:hypothetical protein